jgi:hypothetical protein
VGILSSFQHLERLGKISKSFDHLSEGGHLEFFLRRSSGTNDDRSIVDFLSRVFVQNSSSVVSGPSSAFPMYHRGTRSGEGDIPASPIAIRPCASKASLREGREAARDIPADDMSQALAGAPRSEDDSPVGLASYMFARSRTSRCDPSSSG